ncbi:low temperature requirement protein A [Agromyces larvae]|uniref:Low temperature requirement protein A n=1 Tax=Agromyces larvae TaxID=2929802 RepID=A0ABY4BZP5_9MICO|nr:low temperature requirement protein A [Agromyces larvae]UOE44640.1 low temperature requirement protein A [Agromyces larvae]
MTEAHPPLHHRPRRMSGRDPGEPHRASTPLELLFDLTFVVAFSQAGSQAAHLLELGHWAPAIGAFSFAVFAIAWAWINYSWLASAYDNDDVWFRLATMLAMVGVLVLALGIPPLFASIDAGVHVDNGLVVAGYVIMRTATIALWLRVAHDDPAHRATALTYAVVYGAAQVGWVALAIVNLPFAPTLAFAVALMLVELIGTVAAERRGATPWHPHHIAERYGLLVIITLGEIVLGTILAISAVVEEQGWSLDAILVAFGGTLLVFGLWWVYFMMPSGEVLARRHRDGFTWSAFAWGYGHLVIFGSIAATGAGLHVAANSIEGLAHIGATAALLTVAVPVAVFIGALLALQSLLLRRFDPFQVLLSALAILVLGAAAVAVAAGLSLAEGIAITACAPVVVVIGFESVGHRRQARALARALA